MRDRSLSPIHQQFMTEAPGDGHVRLLVGEDVDHDHRERNHQGLDNQLRPRPPPPVSLAADVQRRERLGGLLNVYHREAA